MNNTQKLQYILNGLIQRYKTRVPDVQKVIDAMIKQDVIKHASDIENDHIAFRTLAVPNLGVTSLEKIFIHYGYIKKDYYYFAEKKLNAWWFAPPEDALPRIFISELRVNDLSAEAQRIIHSYTATIDNDPVDQLNLSDPLAVDEFLHHALWALPTLNHYEALLNESEYAAWTILNRYYLNHFTIAVHLLKEGYNTIQQFNAFLENNGIVLNDSGGKIKTSDDGLLLQSSTVAEMVMQHFAGGEEKLIPGSYLEFAERKVLPEFERLVPGSIMRHHRREGFEAANANKIFESTYLEQVTRK